MLITMLIFHKWRKVTRLVNIFNIGTMAHIELQMETLMSWGYIATLVTKKHSLLYQSSHVL